MDMIQKKLSEEIENDKITIERLRKTIKDLKQVEIDSYDSHIVFKPIHPSINNLLFKDKDTAILANAIAVVASKSNLSANDLSYLTPAILRMLKSKSDWAE